LTEVVSASWDSVGLAWYAIKALIKYPKLVAAAMIAKGLDNSYTQGLLFAVEANDIERQMQQLRGAALLGAGLERWIKEAPGFNLDKVETPVRIEAMGHLSVLQE
jgi:hypothetical protein